MPEKINKMPKFYMIFARKIIFPNLGGGTSAPLPQSPTPVTVLRAYCRLKYALPHISRDIATNYREKKGKDKTR